MGNALGNTSGLHLPLNVTFSQLEEWGLTVLSLSGLERMLRAYTSHSSFSDTESQKNTAALIDEVNICRVRFLDFDERSIFRMLVFWPI